MGKITLILGGARSGKSGYALKLAAQTGRRVAFIATCQPADAQMRRRVARHKKSRPRHWQTFEEPQVSPALLRNIGARYDCLLIDCLTLMVSQFMLKGFSSGKIEERVKKMLAALSGIKACAILVSNEVGLGIVPENKLAREFRDIAGRVNQLAAKKADQVFFLAAGLPWRIK